MIFATLDIELPDDPDFLALEALNPAWPWWWMRLVQAAKRFNQKGLVCNSDGRPLRARDLAIVHHRELRREQDWAEMLDACVNLGLLADEDEAYRIVHWRRWHRSPSDLPEETRVRKQESRRNEASRDVTNGHECHETEQSIAEQSRARAEKEQSSSIAEHGTGAPSARAAAAAGGSSLEVLRPLVGQALDQLGLMTRPTGRWWSAFTSWAAAGLEAGATPDDLAGALTYAVEKTRHDQPEHLWPYAMSIAAGELGHVARRNRMRREWEAGGRQGPEPRPYRFEPEEAA